jgi:hypothetical protein
MVNQQWTQINAYSHMLLTFQVGKDVNSTIEMALLWCHAEATQRLDSLSDIKATKLSNPLSYTNQILEQAGVVSIQE